MHTQSPVHWEREREYSSNTNIHFYNPRQSNTHSQEKTPLACILFSLHRALASTPCTHNSVVHSPSHPSWTVESGQWTVEHIDHGSHRVVNRKKSALISLPTSRFTTSTAPFSSLSCFRWSGHAIAQSGQPEKKRLYGRCFYVLLCLSHLSISSSSPFRPSSSSLSSLSTLLSTAYPPLHFGCSVLRISHHFHDACLFYFLPSSKILLFFSVSLFVCVRVLFMCVDICTCWHMDLFSWTMLLIHYLPLLFPLPLFLSEAK